MYQIGFFPWYVFKKTFLNQSSTRLLQGIQFFFNEHIRERIADFGAFNEEVEINEMICNKIQTSTLLWKEDLETVI